ncbi:arginine--tRNA ligase [Ferruginibacter lapsinanis]|uniref:arginine--tRNA ligase n=1 Tax=Ferruginibacter lapsinanis TaxID=563172 RepID=UPI001E4D4ADC|nr:arginine--tRNA ligase [Ferruginibacter lapsinanis]UEG49171.1 arginine--tRNA ligase [Ferruginibacter lapsinanis]
MSIVTKLQKSVIESLTSLYNQAFTEKDFQINQTKPEFEGDYTVVLFSLVKSLKLSPDAIGNSLGEHLVTNNPHLFTHYNIIKGFLNLTVSDIYWSDLLNQNYTDVAYGKKSSNGKKVMVEYSSPNTNKPLHLGHLRNNFLGWSVAEILKANGYEVIKSCIVNDRGIHICKSMIAWQLFANGATPESTRIKGDHFVGDYYVKFENELKRQAVELATNEESGNFSHYSSEEETKVKELKNLYLKLNTENAEKDKLIKINEEVNDIRRGATTIMKQAKQMLFDWEAGKPEVLELWKTMNSWVYAGFDVTYKRIGSDFNKTYYESNTYLLGKDIVQQGLDKKVFYKKEDGSIWIDLTAEGLDEKLVQRKDGTSVYITQDIGLALQKYEEYKIDSSIYVIGNEQNYHMKVLQLICQKLGMPNADNIYHLSYGMVELTTGKMKSREGTVVDADDLVDEMVATSQQHTEELGKVKDFTPAELTELYDTIGLGAMKFYLLRVDPKKTMVFNPAESIDFHGFTGPFVQYTHARIKSILRKNPMTDNKPLTNNGLLKLEKEVIVTLEQYPTAINQACTEHNPSVIANYVFNLAKTFNSFYTEHSIANAETDDKKRLRLQLAVMTSNVLKSGMELLGIRVPERM